MSNTQIEIGTHHHLSQIDRGGKIVVVPPYGTVDVRIREIWNAGAKIELRFEFELGRNFALIFPANRTLVEVELAAQIGCVAHVRFKGPPRSISIHRYRPIHDVNYQERLAKIN